MSNLVVSQRDVDGFARAQVTSSEIKEAVAGMTGGGVYEVWEGGRKKRIANAAAINSAFVNRASVDDQVGIEILDVGKNKTQAWAHVAAYFGPKANPRIRSECKVIFDFDMMSQKLIWDAIDKGVYLWRKNEDGKPYKAQMAVDYALSSDGIPVPSDPDVRNHLIRLFLQKKMFAERDAETHARERAQRQLLAEEWREREEAESEREEIEATANAKNAERGYQQTARATPVQPAVPNAPNVDLCVQDGPAKGWSYRGLIATQAGCDEIERLLKEGVLDKVHAASAEAALVMASKPKPTNGSSGPATTAMNAPTSEGKRGPGRPKKADASAAGQPPSPMPPPPPPPPRPPAATVTNSGLASGATAKTDAVMAASGGKLTPTVLATAIDEANAILNPPIAGTFKTAEQMLYDDEEKRTAAAVIAERARIIGAIRERIANWPYIVVDAQIEAYAGPIGVAAGHGAPLALADAKPEHLNKLLDHATLVDKVYGLAIAKFGKGKAEEWLGAQCAKIGHEKGFFDVWLRSSNIRFIEKELANVSMVAANNPAAVGSPLD